MNEEDMFLYAPRIIHMVRDFSHVLSAADLKLCVGLLGPITSKGRRESPDDSLYLEALRDECGEVVFCQVEDLPRFLVDRRLLVRVLAAHRLELGS